MLSLSYTPLLLTGSGRHSLWALATHISGSTLFPEFSLVLMLDDIQVGYYDSETDKIMRVSGRDQKGAELGLGQEATYVLQNMLHSMSKKMNMVRDQLNLTTADVCVHQRMVGCEVQGDSQLTNFVARDGINGDDTDGVEYNTTHFVYSGGDGWKFQWDSLRHRFMEMMFTKIYVPIFVRTLRQLLDREKNLVMRRVRPRVRLTSQLVLGGAQITCLATDFYPRHINLTLLRDGEPVDEDQLSGGLVLPNGNGLYQLRKMLTIDEEELQRKHKYTCAASHLSLDNQLDVSWRPQSFRSHRVHVISAPIVLIVATILLLVLLMKMRKRGRAGSKDISMGTQEEPAESVETS
ncbi:hereditary hemochromatosis protein homolog [Xenentodon cancila]